MPPYYQPPDHTPGDDLSRHFRTLTLTGLAVLAVTIAWFAFTAPDLPDLPDPQTTPTPTARQAGVTEERITLTDGRTVTCLFFPGPEHAISCDWHTPLR